MITPEQKAQILPELPSFILNASLSETEAVLLAGARPEGITKGKEFVIGPIHRWAKKYEHRALVEPKSDAPVRRSDDSS